MVFEPVVFESRSLVLRIVQASQLNPQASLVSHDRDCVGTQHKDARALLDIKFGRPAIRRKFASVFSYVDREISGNLPETAGQ